MEAEGEAGAFSWGTLDDEGPIGLENEALDDGEAETGAGVWGFGGDAFVKHFGENFGRNSGASIADDDGEKGGGIGKIFLIDDAEVGVIGEIDFGDGEEGEMAGDFDEVGIGARLEGVDGEVEENLEEIGAVDGHEEVMVEALDGEAVAMGGGVAVEEFGEIAHHLIDGDRRFCGGLGVEEAEVASGDLDASADLAIEALEVFLNIGELFAFHAGGVFHGAVDEFGEAGDDGQGAIDIVEDAGINFALAAGEFFGDLVSAEVFLEAEEFLISALEVTRSVVFFDGEANGGANRGNFERFIEVIAGAESEGLAGGFDGFKGREENDFDGGVDGFDFFEGLYPGHPEHHNIENHDIDGLGFDEFDGVEAVGCEEDVVIVFEDDAEGLAGPVLIVDDEESGFWFWGLRVGEWGRIRNGIRE